jgi:hypothetical protein
MTREQFRKIRNAIVPDQYGCRHYPGATRGFHFNVWIKGEGRRKVHQLALEEKLGRPLRPGFYALHHCDYPSCVELSHLYEGTHADNMRDRQLRNPDSYKVAGEAIKKKHREDPVFRAKQLANLAKGTEAFSKKYWEDPEFRAKMQAYSAKGVEARKKKRNK